MRLRTDIDTHLMTLTRGTRHRSGNAMVLVAGLLVLLVILATAFVTRTQSTRVNARSNLSHNSRLASAEGLARGFADEIARALFTEPLVATGLGTWPDANTPRALATLADDNPNDQVIRRYGADPAFPYNYAPYAVIPWTNWPDERGNTAFPSFWPAGPGVTTPNVNLRTGNPLGAPGMGDSRWLASLEPMRWDSSVTGVLAPNAFKFWPHMTNIARANNGWRVIRDLRDVTNLNGTGGIVTNLNIPIEQWLTDPDFHPPALRYDATGRALVDNNFLFRWKQWMNDNPAFYGAAYTSQVNVPHNFIDLTLLNDAQRRDVLRILADADGDGFTDSFWFLAPGASLNGTRRAVAIRIVDNSGMLNANVATEFSPGHDDLTFADNEVLRSAGETPADLALVGQRFTPAANVTAPGPDSWNTGFLDNHSRRERVFTSSFGINSMYWDGGDPSETGPMGDYHVNYDGARWAKLVAERGYDLADWDFTSPLARRDQRTAWWLYGASRPLDAPRNYSTFGLADEIELRMYNGLNSPWIYSRFESAVNGVERHRADNPVFDAQYNILRSFPFAGFRETTGAVDHVNNRELFLDLRHRLTLYSGARNDELPPWLWWRWGWGPGDPGLPARTVDIASTYQPADRDAIYERFLMQQRQKLDLREANPLDLPQYANNILTAGRLKLHERLPYALLNALSDGDATGRPLSQINADSHGRVNLSVQRVEANSYLGPYTQGGPIVDKLRRLSASLTANLLAYRDYDVDLFNNVVYADRAPLYDQLGLDIGGFVQQRTGQLGAIPLPDWGRIAGTNSNNARFLGMEKQPFIVEAFIAHVHASDEVPDLQGTFLPFWEQDLNYVDSSHDSTTIVAVQIANPYDQAITREEMSKYGIRVFDRTVWLDTLLTDPVNPLEALPPASETEPFTAVFYMIPDEFAGDSEFHNKWVDFLDLEFQEGGAGPDMHPRGISPRDPTWSTRFYNVTPYQVWESERVHYDAIDGGGGGGGGGSGGGNHLEVHHRAIELVRRDTSHPDAAEFGGATPATQVVVDRVDGTDGDQHSFFDAVQSLEVPPVPHRVVVLQAGGGIGGAPPPGSFSELAGIRIEGDRFVAWARVSRAWGVDANFDMNDASTLGVTPDETAPRFIIAREDVDLGGHIHGEKPDGVRDGLVWRGNDYDSAAMPDVDAPPVDYTIQPAWFTRTYKNAREELIDRKPTFFDGARYSDEIWSDLLTAGDFTYQDKGFYDFKRFPHSLQMLQKDADFSTIGEIYNVWLWGHELEFDAPAPLANYVHTTRTFSEFMADPEYVDNTHADINRLRLGDSVGKLPLNPGDFDPNHRVPLQPAGIRVMDLFVCDGPGFNRNPGLVTHTDHPERFWLRNAQGFEGKLTQGLININTAPVEVMQSIPHWYKMVHWNAPTTPTEHWRYARSMIADSVEAYRLRTETPWAGGAQGIGGGTSSGLGVDYRTRNIGGAETVGPDEIRGELGFASTGELRMLRRFGSDFYSPGGSPNNDYGIRRDSWSILFGGFNPFRDRGLIGNTVPEDGGFGADTSLDAVCLADSTQSGPNNENREWENDYSYDDGVAGDVEEMNMLLSAASNVTTVRSDVFTVYFKIRTFKQSTSTPGLWDATDPNAIVDETRYVMLVDRSNVIRPGDEPKILYVERVPF